MVKIIDEIYQECDAKLKETQDENMKMLNELA